MRLTCLFASAKFRNHVACAVSRTDIRKLEGLAQATEDNGAAMLAWTLDLQEREVKEACCELGFVLVED